MAIDAIGLTAPTATTTTQNAGISQDDFLRILLTQLRFQDPLKPIDNQQFVAQLAQFSALEINRQQSEKIDTLLTIQGADQAVGLLGRTVDVATAAGSVTGVVGAISFASGEPRLTIRTASTTLVDVRLSQIALVR
jgi:flagellar basal-body rod modification protein FlgD